MSFYRKTSLEEFNIPNWRWQPFLNQTIKSLSRFNLEPLSLSQEFLMKESYFGSKNKSNKVITNTWASKTLKLRKIRAACVEAGTTASVLNLVIYPFNSYDLPFFGADFVTLPSGHLLALDFQPALKFDKIHTEKTWERLSPFYEHWKGLLPNGGPIPRAAESFFSPFFLWSRLPLGEESNQLLEKVLMPAYVDYLELYLDLVNEAEHVSKERSISLLNGQKKYIKYRAENDPARNMLTRFYGTEWTESYINDVLFCL